MSLSAFPYTQNPDIPNVKWAKHKLGIVKVTIIHGTHWHYGRNADLGSSFGLQMFAWLYNII